MTATGTYRVRFMPDNEGEWTLRDAARRPPALDGKTGALRLSTAPSAGNHGPVRVRNQFHFAYADGTPYFPFGTTCYAWTHQPLDDAGRDAGDAEEDALQQDPHGRLPEGLSLQRQRAAARRLRARRRRQGRLRPAEPGRVPALRERRSAALRDLGIEADIIIFHPYDRWGYCQHDRRSRTSAMSPISRRGSPPIATSGGRSPTSTTSCSTPSRWRSGTATSTSSRRTIPTGHLKSIHNGDVRR